LHVKVQTLDAHAPTAFGAPGHALPHDPQLVADVDVLVSHPSVQVPLQLAKGGVHEQPEVLHVPPTQTGGPPSDGQTLPQAPQLFTSAPRYVSHPSAAFPLQSPKPASQEPTAHAPAEQFAVACSGAQGAQLAAAQPVAGSVVGTQLDPQSFVPGPHPASPESAASLASLASEVSATASVGASTTSAA
jgi:hypothetical protein